MSKQPSDNTKRNLLRRGLAGILTLALVLGLLPAAVAPAQAHWADPYVNTLVEWGVMRGDVSGNMAPERSITRAEFVTMMNRAYGYTKTAGHPFTDVRSRDWYNEDIDIAYNIGYFKGTSPTTASPNSPLTREQAAVLLARNMMMQPTVGETLGFSDSRTLSEWSRGLVGAATENGILSGYNDGSFKPQNNITRGEVAAMLVRAIGTPIQTAGDHALGNVYGNVTVNTSGVKLRDGVITGNLYLTGGIDLGEVLMENVTVLGEIIVSGAGESNSSQSSIILRNVTANAMSVASIGDQFVTIRAEGNTDIKKTTVRTNAYVDDSSLPGYGLWQIIQDGGKLLQLAGNTKEVINKTPDSELQIVQGVADKVTIDEKATNSSVLVDGDARVDELDLDVATKVTGDGDIKDLNVGAAGSTVEQLPDNVTIRPGITTDINGSNMNSAQAAELSSDPMLLAGYPKAKNVAPTSATLVFSVNKPGTIYWAVSAVADGSVSENDLIENPSYGGKIIKAGSIKADKANTEYTVNLSGLTQDGSYYISAILVDGRDNRSPVKVAAFATPDGTKPAFISGPTVTMATTKTAQVTGMPNKSCQLFWALLPEGAAAPTAAEFKANAVKGNLGYGSMDVTKNVSQSVNVNRGNLKEKTRYVAYLWLTDHDGAQSSQVYRVPIYIPDETPPVVSNVRQTNSDATSVEVSFTMNETGKLHWAIVTDEMHEAKTFIDWLSIVSGNGADYLDIVDEDSELSFKIKVMAGSGQGAIVSGATNVTAANTVTRVLQSAARGLDPEVYGTSTFYMYYVGEDSEKPSNLSEHIGVIEVNVRDTTAPEFIEQRFDSYNPNDKVHPLSDTGVSLVFSEPIQHGAASDREKRILNLYTEVKNLVDRYTPENDDELIAARDALGRELYEIIKLYQGDTEVKSDFNPSTNGQPNTNYKDNILNYRYATVTRGNGEFVITFPHGTGLTGIDGPTGENVPIYGANFKSGATYHFELANIYDCAITPNKLEPNTSKGVYQVEDFRIAYAQVSLKENGFLPGILYKATMDEAHEITYFQAEDKQGEEYGELINTDQYNVLPDWSVNPPQRKDAWFTVTPVEWTAMTEDPDSRYDILFWSDRAMTVSLYSREVPTSATEAAQAREPWKLEGTAKFTGNAGTEDGFIYRSLMRDFRMQNSYDMLSGISKNREYAIHIDELQTRDGLLTKPSATWYDTVHIRISVVAGSTSALEYMNTGLRGTARYDEALKRNDLSSLGIPDYEEATREFNPSESPKIKGVNVINNDTNPALTVTLDNPGFVNYLIVKVSNMRYLPAGSTDETATVPIPLSQRISEGMIVGPDTTPYFIRSYSTVGADVYETGSIRPELGDIPNMEKPARLDFSVGSPNPAALTSVRYNGAFQQGATTKAGPDDPQPITLRQPMEPNSIYLILMAPQGQEGEPKSLSDYTYCFRLTTEAAAAPTLTLTRNTGVDVNAKVSKDAFVRTWLIVDDNLTGNNIFTERLSDPGNLNLDHDYDFTPYTNYTVKQALTATVGDGRSVFDVFASDELKARLATIIRSGNGAEENLSNYALYDHWEGNVRAATGATSQFNKVEQDDDTVYFCVGYAVSSNALDPTGPWSFSGVSGLTKVVDQQPKVNWITNGLSYVEDPDNPKNNYITGTISIQFTTYLYLESAKGFLPLAVANTTNPTEIVKGVGGAEFKPLIFARNQLQTGVTPIYSDDGSHVRRRDISFTVDKVYGNSITIIIPEVFSQFTRSSNGTTTVTFQYAGNNNWKITANHLVSGYNPNA